MRLKVRHLFVSKLNSLNNTTFNKLFKFIQPFEFEGLFFIDSEEIEIETQKGQTFLVLDGKKWGKEPNKIKDEMILEIGKRGYDGIIMSCIKDPEHLNYGHIEYINTGTWTESFTVVVEDYDGKMKLIKYEE